MELIFLYGPPASGKLTVGRHLADLTGYALFHNHLVVDAVGAVFAFGSAPFVRLREAFWLDVLEEAARADASLIFTFAPEGTVDPGFPERAGEAVRRAGGAVRFFALTVGSDEQKRRIGDPGRGAFGKMTSVDLLLSLQEDFARCFEAMPPAELTIDTTVTPPREAALQILKEMRGHNT